MKSSQGDGSEQTKVHFEILSKEATEESKIKDQKQVTVPMNLWVPKHLPWGCAKKLIGMSCACQSERIYRVRWNSPGPWKLEKI